MTAVHKTRIWALVAAAGWFAAILGWNAAFSVPSAESVGTYAARSVADSEQWSADVVGADGVCASLRRPGGIDDMITASNGGRIPTEVSLDTARAVWRGITTVYCTAQ